MFVINKTLCADRGGVTIENGIATMENKTRGVHSIANINMKKLCHWNILGYLGSSSSVCKPDLLKKSERPTGLELNYYYPELPHEEYIII